MRTDPDEICVQSHSHPGPNQSDKPQDCYFALQMIFAAAAATAHRPPPPAAANVAVGVALARAVGTIPAQP